jgi:predicted metal-dependent hydrolase
MRSGITNLTKRLRQLIKKPTRRRTHYDIHIKEARVLILERVRHFAPLCEVNVKRVAIRNQKRCWGSCSSLGNLNFNYKLLFLPPCQRDYIIVHELSHLKVLNHSQRFWSEVQKVCPQYKEVTLGLRALERSSRMRPALIAECALRHECVHCKVD